LAQFVVFGFFVEQTRFDVGDHGFVGLFLLVQLLEHVGNRVQVAFHFDGVKSLSEVVRDARFLVGGGLAHETQAHRQIQAAVDAVEVFSLGFLHRVDLFLVCI